ncbi:MAG: hypothetical protein ACQETI_14735 [Halobacteriota archaeon]
MRTLYGWRPRRTPNDGVVDSPIGEVLKSFGTDRLGVLKQGECTAGNTLGSSIQ